MTKRKKILTALTSFAACAAMAAVAPQTAKADNPAIQTIYSTDPAPMVYGDTVYLYTGRDADNSNNYYMPDWHCFSSQDMQNWTDHGTILSWDSFKWGKKDSAWAAQCIERNGKFYYYVTLENNSGGGRAIGVAVADSPTGPFKDALGKPLCGPHWEYIDPTVFIDDDGQAWLMFGNPSCYYVKLKEDMVTLDGEIRKFDMNAQTFGPSSKTSSYGEGPWFYKRGDLYYLVFAAFYGSDGGESLGYSTAPTPTGPWTYGGQVMKTHNCFTNHPGVIDFKGKSYLFYHDASLPGGGSFDRSVCVDEFTYGSDGSIPTISPSKTGPKQIKSFDPFRKVEAETMCWSSGVKTEECSSGGLDLCNIEDGDFVKIKGVDFGSGADRFTASVASATEGGMIELHTGSEKGPIVGACKVPGTDGWQEWTEVSCDASVSGVEDLYLTFKGDSGYLFNIDWWKFSGAGAADIKEDSTEALPTQAATKAPSETPVSGEIFHHTFESSDSDWTNRFGAETALSTGAAYKGSKSLFVSDRTDAYTGALLTLGNDFKAGQEYSFSVNVMYPTGSDSETFHFTLSYEDSEGETHYEKITTGVLTKGKWSQLANTNFKLPAGASNMQIYVETGKSTCDFYIDEAVAATAGTVIFGAPKALNPSRPGDVNCDGSINAFDVVFARQGLANGFTNPLFEKSADADRSGTVEINDLVLIQEYALGKISEFPDNRPPEPEKPEFNYDANLQYHEPDPKYLDPCSQAGTITKETYNGIRGTKSLNVYTPYGYDPSKKYNIFYLMHGGSENENTVFSNDVKLQNILDHMIMNGELEPLIVVTPTFNGTGSEAANFWEEFKENVVPFVEGKYSTYAESTSFSDLQASRMHRAYGGFSMGGLSTWCVADHDMDIVGYFMPLSGNNWEGMDKLTGEIDSLGFTQRDYFILAATGDEDMAYGNMKPEMDDLKTNKTKYFTYTSDFSKGNFYFLVAPSVPGSKKTHWWGFVRWYIYDGLPYFFHEGQ